MNKKIKIPKCFKGKDFYEILGVNKNASTQEINKAYKKLSLQYHPDRNINNTDTTQEFQYLARIHEILTKDPARRKLYDRHGDDGNDVRIYIL